MFAALVCSAWNGGPLGQALGVHPASWSSDPLSCAVSPAGFGRIEGRALQASGTLSKDAGTYAAAASLPLGRGFTGAVSGFFSTEGEDDRGTVQLSGCYVVTGDPIGFMEGLYGPSVTAGVSVAGVFGDSADSPDQRVDLGVQFSLFPSFAVGVQNTDLFGEAVFNTGFSHVFNRSLEIHVNYGDDTWQGGAELTVSSLLSILAGTDGNSLNAGFELAPGMGWKAGYAVEFREDSLTHTLGMQRSFP